MNPGSHVLQSPEAALLRVTCKLYATNFTPLHEKHTCRDTISTYPDAIASPPDAYTVSTRVDGVCRWDF